LGNNNGGDSVSDVVGIPNYRMFNFMWPIDKIEHGNHYHEPVTIKQGLHYKKMTVSCNSDDATVDAITDNTNVIHQSLELSDHIKVREGQAHSPPSTQMFAIDALKLARHKANAASKLAENGSKTREVYQVKVEFGPEQQKWFKEFYASIPTEIQKTSEKGYRKIRFILSHFLAQEQYDKIKQMLEPSGYKVSYDSRTSYFGYGRAGPHYPGASLTVDWRDADGSCAIV